MTQRETGFRRRCVQLCRQLEFYLNLLTDERLEDLVSNAPISIREFFDILY